MSWCFGKWDPDTEEKQDGYRNRDAEHALNDKQPRDEARARNGRERDHCDKLRVIRSTEVNVQKNGVGGQNPNIKPVR